MQKDNYIIIEKYLNGKLSEEEKKTFQLRLNDDAEFAKEYTLQKSMNIFLEKKRNQPALQSQLEALGNDFFQEEKIEKNPIEKEAKTIPIHRNKNRKWLIGLIATAAVALLLMMWNPFQSNDLYDQYAAHSPISLTEKSTATDLGTKAETAFNQNNYVLAYQNLTIYLQENSTDNKARLALGISALETGKTSEAIDIFTQIHNGTSALKNYGTWYLALTYLKEKDTEKAKSFLMQIPESEKLLFKKAQECSQRL